MTQVKSLQEFLAEAELDHYFENFKKDLKVSDHREGQARVSDHRAGLSQVGGLLATLSAEEI